MSRFLVRNRYYHALNSTVLTLSSRSLCSKAVSKVDNCESTELEIHKPVEEKDKYNYWVFHDLFLKKFDDDLLRFPETIDLFKWNNLVDRGRIIEDYVQNLNYKEVLSKGVVSKMIRKELGDLGVFGMTIPKEYGGLGYTNTETKYIHEILAYCPSIARVIAENADMGIRVLNMFGTEEQKQKYLPQLASGEKMIAFAFLEPNSSLLDVNSYMNTVMVQNGSDMCLLGEKSWVFNASIADYIIVFANHSVIEEDSAFHIQSLFLVEKPCEGLIVSKPLEKHWFKGLDICNVTFQEVAIKPENIIGGFGNGIEILKEILHLSKSHVSAECAAQSKRLVYDAAKKCNESKLFNKPMVEYYHNLGALGELSTMAFAIESVTYYSAARLDKYKGSDLTLESLMSKIFTSQALPEALQLYFNLVGKNGYECNTFVDELVQNSHYYSLIDDNNFNMKLYLITECLKQYARREGEFIKKLSNNEAGAVDCIKMSLSGMRPPPTTIADMELPMALHAGLNGPAKNLENCIARMAHCARIHLLHYGNIALEQDYDTVNMAEMLVEIYALIACIARTNVLLFSKNDHEALDHTLNFSYKVLERVTHLSNLHTTMAEQASGTMEIGRKTFLKKQYVAEHPLTRNY